jgi:hypothetical protein
MSEQYVQENRSLALHMREVFARLPNGNVPLHNAWRSVLQVEGDDSAIYDGLRLLNRALDRLEAQIMNSRRMSDSSKKIVLPIVNNMQASVKITNLSHTSNAYSSHFSGEKLDKLTLIADQLGAEFPEPQLRDKDIETIKGALRDLDQLLSETDLDPLLQSILTAHILQMRWALENHAIVGLDGLYDVLGRSFADFHRAAHNVKDPGKHEGWWKKTKNRFVQMFAAVDKVDRAYRAGKDAAEIGSYLKEQGLLSFLDGS